MCSKTESLMNYKSRNPFILLQTSIVYSVGSLKDDLSNSEIMKIQRNFREIK